MKKLLLVGSLALLALAACGSDSDDAAGTLRIEAHVQPDPPVVGQNTLHLTVHDAAGEPVAGAALEVVPFMPAHGHGSSETPVVTDDGAGRYTAAPVTLTMPGRWEVTITAEAGGEEGELVLDWDVQ